MKWVKIENGCEMPEDGDAGLLVCIDFGSNREIHVGDFRLPISSSRPWAFDFSDEIDYQIWHSGGAITHWARVELPEDME